MSKNPIVPVRRNCPFCNYGQSVICSNKDGDYVTCKRCGAKGPPVHGQDVAIFAWNVRDWNVGELKTVPDNASEVEP